MSYNYRIQFKSLRSGTLYSVNIGGGTSNIVWDLKAGAQPFVTEEDSDDDMFAPIRTQTGYLRIVDDGYDADGYSFNWKDLIPATDTARPVTLTHQSGGSTIVDWQGFMQAQDFGNTLYGNPQEREFPIQCVLSVTQGTDINYQQTQIQNFAYLLKQIVDSIPSAQRPTSFMIQGGADAQAWLLKQIDWQNFVSEDGDGNLTARYSMYDCLEDMCRFWGWTARTKGSTLYLTCADDATTEPNWLSMDATDLATMAGGTAAGTTTTTFDTTTLTGDIFANTSQNDYVQRGYNKAVVTAYGGKGDENVLEISDAAASLLLQQGWQSYITEDDNKVRFTNDLQLLSFPLFIGSAVSGAASFNLADYTTKSTVISGIVKTSANTYDRVIMIKQAYSSGVILASLETQYEHCFSHDFLELNGKIFQNTEEYDDVNESTGYGNAVMYIRIGIGKTKELAKWFDGEGWSNTPTELQVEIGTKQDALRIKAAVSGGTRYIRYIFVDDHLYGKLFIDFLGSSNIKEHEGSRDFQIQNPFIKLYQDQLMLLMLGYWEYVDSTTFADPVESREYKASNVNNVRDEFNADCIYATNNDYTFGYGVLINADGSYMWNAQFNGISQIPEQHLANRVVNYWQTSRRRLEVELRTNAVAYITPRYKITIDGTTGYPIAISHDWRDDITKLTILEI